MILASLIFGLIIGSFLTVCVYRIPYGRPKGPPDLDELDDSSGKTDAEEDVPAYEPRTPGIPEEMSILKPARSICPSCGKQLLWWHNIPLVSWILLRGKCAFCGTRISGRYPLIEAMTAFFCVLSYMKFGLTPTGVLIFAFCCALIVISFIDIEYYIIPDVISLPTIVIGLAAGGLNHFTHIFTFPLAENFWWSLAGFAFGGGILMLISQLYTLLRHRVGLGFGDVKFLAMAGALFGIEGAFITMFAGSLAGSVIGLLMFMFMGKTMTYHLPFGPYLALGALIYIFGADPNAWWRASLLFY